MLCLRPLRVAILARAETPERRYVERAVARQFPAADVKVHGEPAERWPDSAARADLSLVVQSWPDEMSGDLAARLLSASLAARLLCCQGPWCLSDGRTRSVWPHAVRVPLDQLSARLRYESGVILGRRPPLSCTAARDEVFTATLGETPLPTAAPIHVITPDRALGESLQSALNAADGPGGRASVVLVDVDPWGETAAARLHEARRSCPGATVITLAGFPHADLVRQLAACGSSITLSKLTPLTELRALIEEHGGAHWART